MADEYFVNAAVRPGPPYVGCHIFKKGDMVANHHKVFGYASKAECEDFIRRNCTTPPRQSE